MLSEPSLGEVDERPGGAPCGTLTAMRIALARRAAIACAVMAAASLQNACAAGLVDSEVPSRESAVCPPPAGERGDAAILADRIMSRSSSRLLFDPPIHDELAREAEDVLRMVRAAHPGVAGIHVRGLFRPDTLILGLEPPMLQRVQGMFDTSGRTVTLRTGAPELDSLNAELGLRGAKLLGQASVAFCFGPVLNLPPAAAAYSGLDGISYAEPDTYAGDGPDIDAARADGDWYLIFRNAWGDCPSGCINEQFSFFVISGGTVSQTNSGAAPFRRLMAERGWDLSREA